MPILARRLLPLLQLTRMALVFTAVADSLCAMLLWAQRHRQPGQAVWDVLRPDWVVGMMVVSVGLYGFGMSLNDIIDRRRDERLAAHRPLPSGRVGVATAHFICALLALAAIVGGVYYALRSPAGWPSLVLVVWTIGLIVFYDFAGKWLVGSGLLALGLIRFSHAAAAAPELPVLWHPLILLNHVALLSTVAYVWEEKRPALRRLHLRTVLGGLAFVNLVVIGLVLWRRGTLDLRPALLGPVAAGGVFVLLARMIRRRAATQRSAGQTLMLSGLLWLIVYDAAFAAAYVEWREGLLILAMLPVAYLSVQLMRWWGNLLALSQRPTFKRVQ